MTASIDPNRLASLLRRLHCLAGDLQALDIEEEADAAGAVISELAELERTLGRLEETAVKRSVSQISRRLSAILAERRSEPLRLHLGAGSRRLEGWINVDSPPSDLSLNLARGIPLPEGSVRMIFCSHLVEHLFYPSEAERLLGDCFRVLALGGVLRLIVPDAEACLRAYVEKDHRFFQARRSLWAGWPSGRTRLEDTLPYLGAFPDPGGLYETHRFGYDFETIARVLSRVGFARVERSEYMTSRIEDLRVDHASDVAAHRHPGGYFSMFVEAYK